MESDFIVHTAGSVWAFEPVSESAKEAAKGFGLEGWQWLGNRFGVDARVGYDLVTRLEEEGFVLELR